MFYIKIEIEGQTRECSITSGLVFCVNNERQRYDV